MAQEFQKKIAELGLILPPTPKPQGSYIAAVRTGNLVFSLFAFQIYLNLLNLGQNWIAQEKIGFLAFIVLLHGGVLLLSALWLTIRHNNWSLSLWPRSGVQSPHSDANA